MILYIYALKNRISGIFERPITERIEPSEYGEQLAQSLAFASIDALNMHKEFDVYFLGEFDTKSAEIKDTKVDFVCSLEQLCNDYILKKKGESDGKE